MIDIKELRHGSHVLVGSSYSTFSVPKHYAVVTGIFRDHIECVSGSEQQDPDVYDKSEVDGIDLSEIVPVLEKNGFYKSKLSNSRYIKETHYHDRMVVNFNGTCTCNGVDLVERTGVKYLHQLEACISDAKIDFDFDFHNIKV